MDVWETGTTEVALPLVSQLPEEAVQQLDATGLEWAVTESGDLWIRTWTLVEEGFVTPEQAAEIRALRPVRSHTSLNWVGRNLSTLKQQYAGQWVAVQQDQVVEHDHELATLLERIRVLGIVDPFVTQIPAGEVRRRYTAYALEGLRT